MLAGMHNVHLIEPLEYASFIYLLKHCYLVVTDSGGLQEEAPAMGKPVLVLRDVSERSDALLSGAVELIGTDRENIVATVSEILDVSSHYRSMTESESPYGDGKACDRILDVLRVL
jgi:UDP-N-acetylglucosamine 2-epimerase (non-hydrolysing)